MVGGIILIATFACICGVLEYTFEQSWSKHTYKKKLKENPDFIKEEVEKLEEHKVHPLQLAQGGFSHFKFMLAIILNVYYKKGIAFTDEGFIIYDNPRDLKWFEYDFLDILVKYYPCIKKDGYYILNIDLNSLGKMPKPFIKELSKLEKDLLKENRKNKFYGFKSFSSDLQGYFLKEAYETNVLMHLTLLMQDKKIDYLTIASYVFNKNISYKIPIGLEEMVD